MADEIVLNVEVREAAGGGAARAARRQGKVPGVLYGGKLGPVAIAMRESEFKKALYTGKLLGHLVTLKYGAETQPVIAKDIQFHPVTDVPTHFDLYRVEAGQRIRIAVPVRFRNHEESPGIKRGGALNVNLHELEVTAPANAIPEAVTIDLTGMDIGDSVRAVDLVLPEGVELAPHLLDATVASVATSSQLTAEEEATAAPTEEGVEGEPGAEAPEGAAAPAAEPKAKPEE
jgi:large subunit ribosomal protein L25